MVHEAERLCLSEQQVRNTKRKLGRAERKPERAERKSLQLFQPLLMCHLDMATLCQTMTAKGPVQHGNKTMPFRTYTPSYLLSCCRGGGLNFQKSSTDDFLKRFYDWRSLQPISFLRENIRNEKGFTSISPTNP